MSEYYSCMNCYVEKAELKVMFFCTVQNRYYDSLTNYICKKCSWKIHGKDTEGKIGYATYYEFTKIK